MKKQCLIIAASLFFGSQMIVKAQEKEKEREQLEEVVVVATKFPMKKENLGKIIS